MVASPKFLNQYFCFGRKHYVSNSVAHIIRNKRRVCINCNSRFKGNTPVKSEKREAGDLPGEGG